MPAGAVGAVWESDSWSDTAWEAGAWGELADIPVAPDVTITVRRHSRRPETVSKLSEEVLVCAFDYDHELQAAASFGSVGTFTIDPDDGRLTKDDEALSDDGRSALVRVSGGKPGKTYSIRHIATTNEAPSQTMEWYFYLFIEPSPWR